MQLNGSGPFTLTIPKAAQATLDRLPAGLRTSIRAQLEDLTELARLAPLDHLASEGQMGFTWDDVRIEYRVDYRARCLEVLSIVSGVAGT